MKDYLISIRKPSHSLSCKRKIANTIIIALIGVMLGAFAKWLDTVAINDAIPWQHILGVLDLRNILSQFPVWVLLATAIAVFAENPWRAAYHVFLFFAGMTISYHICSIYLGGFNPQSYMMRWYGIALLSPLPAILCWYAAGQGKAALVLRVLLLAFMMFFAFHIGPWYIACGGIANILFLALMIVLISHGWQDAAIAVPAAFILRALIGMLTYV